MLSMEYIYGKMFIFLFKDHYNVFLYMYLLQRDDHSAEAQCETPRAVDPGVMRSNATSEKPFINTIIGRLFPFHSYWRIFLGTLNSLNY